MSMYIGCGLAFSNWFTTFIIPWARFLSPTGCCKGAFPSSYHGGTPNHIRKKDGLWPSHK